MKLPRCRRLHWAILFLGGLACGPLSAQVIWTGGGATTAWSDNANWQETAAPANDGSATVYFPQTDDISFVQVDTPWHIRGLQFQYSEVSLSGARLYLGDGGIQTLPGGYLEMANDVFLTADQRWGEGPLPFSTFLVVATGSVNLNGNTLTLSSKALSSLPANALSGGLNGSGRLIISEGFWQISGGDFSGDITVNDASLSLAGFAGGAPIQSLTVNGGSLFIDSTINFTALSGYGALGISGSQALTTEAYGDFNGTFHLAAGTFTADSQLLAAKTWGGTNDATLDLGAHPNPALGALAGYLNLALANGNILRVGLSNLSTAYGGTISGDGSLVKSGLGRLELSGSHTFTGGTTVNAGTLAISGGVLPGPLVNHATVELLGGSLTGQVTNHGLIQVTGGTMTGGLVNHGTLRFKDLVPADGYSPIGNGQLEIYTSIRFATVGSGGSFASVEAGVTYTHIFTGDNSLVKSGPGYLILDGANAYARTTTIAEGRLAVVHPLALQNSTVVTEGGPLLFYSPGWARSTNMYGTVSTRLGPYTTTAMLGGLAGGGSVSLSLPDPYFLAAGVAGVALSVGNNHLDTTFSGSITGGAGFTAIYENSGQSTISGYFAPGHLTKIGTGTLTLTGTNSYGGGTTIASGAVQLGNGGTSGSILGDVVNNASLIFNRSDAVTFSGAISGSGHVTKAGTGTLTLSGNNTFSGGLTLAAGLVEFGYVSQLGSGAVTFAGGGLRWGVEAETDISSRLNPSLAAGDAIFDTNGRNVTVSTAFTGAGGLRKIGAGTLALSGFTTFTGNTVVAGGTLALTQPNALQHSTVSLEGGALNFGANPLIMLGGLAGSSNLSLTNTLSMGVTLIVGHNQASTQFGGNLTGTGSLIKTGAGTLTLTGANTLLGSVTLSSGTLQIGAGGTSGSLTSDIANFGTVVFNRSDHLLYAGSISGSGNLVKLGIGTLTLTGASSFEGSSTLSAGTVVASNSSLGTGRLFLNGSSLQAGPTGAVLPNAMTLNTDTTIGGSQALTMTGQLTLAGFKALTITNTARTTFSGGITETSPSLLIKQGAGELELTGAGTYTGGTFIQAGTLRINNPTGSAFGTGAVTVASGATLTGAGSFTGALQLNGIFSPGNSPGSVTTGSETWAAGGTYRWEINDAAGNAGATIGGAGWDLVTISGTLTITATADNRFSLLLLSLLPTDAPGDAINFNAAIDSSYVIASASGGIIGFDRAKFTLNPAQFTNALAGGAWNLIQDGNQLKLTFTAAAIPEPSTYAALAGLTALALAGWRRRRARGKVPRI